MTLSSLGREDFCEMNKLNGRIRVCFDTFSVSRDQVTRQEDVASSVHSQNNSREVSGSTELRFGAEVCGKSSNRQVLSFNNPFIIDIVVILV